MSAMAGGPGAMFGTIAVWSSNGDLLLLKWVKDVYIQPWGPRLAMPVALCPWLSIFGSIFFVVLISSFAFGFLVLLLCLICF